MKRYVNRRDGSAIKNDISNKVDVIFAKNEQLAQTSYLFFFNDTAPTEFSPLSLPDALPISFLVILITDVWLWTPWFALILLAGLQSLPPEPFEAAQIDAASAWRTFRHITLPMLRPVMRSEEHTSELQSQSNLVCRLLLEKKR